jgi:polysaccharide biosynthesis protein PslH
MQAFIVPLCGGGGTRIKILEASLANRPVLSTPIGAEGLDFVDGSNILLFEDSKSFVMQYLNLEKKDTYDQLIREAYTTVKRDFSMANFIHNMDKVLKNIISGGC